MKRWTRKTKQLIMASIGGAATAGLLISTYHYWTTSLNEEALKQTEDKKVLKRTGIWVFKEAFVAGKRINLDDMIKIEMSTDIAPQQVLSDSTKIIGKVLKIDVSPRTPVLPTMLYEDERIANDLRWVETAVVQLPLRLQKNDVIDVRLRFPSGQDYIVLSKKEIKNIQYPTLWIHLNEQERLLFSSACVDAHHNGGQIYALRYVEPQLQSKAVPNYLANEQVLKLMSVDPNIVQKANTELAQILRRKMEQEWNQQPGAAPRHSPLTEKSDEALHNSPFVGQHQGIHLEQ